LLSGPHDDWQGQRVVGARPLASGKHQCKSKSKLHATNSPFSMDYYKRNAELFLFILNNILASTREKQRAGED